MESWSTSGTCMSTVRISGSNVTERGRKGALSESHSGHAMSKPINLWRSPKRGRTALLPGLCVLTRLMPPTRGLGFLGTSPATGDDSNTAGSTAKVRLSESWYLPSDKTSMSHVVMVMFTPWGRCRAICSDVAEVDMLATCPILMTPVPNSVELLGTHTGRGARAPIGWRGSGCGDLCDVSAAIVGESVGDGGGKPLGCILRAALRCLTWPRRSLLG
eukprot:6476948-Amphidinium_carterae.1